ncbi:MAG: Ig-like domain-containing protein [Acidimicrobiales bacterium]
MRISKRIHAAIHCHERLSRRLVVQRFPVEWRTANGNRSYRAITRRMLLLAGSCAGSILVIAGVVSGTAYASQAAPGSRPSYTLTLKAAQAPSNASNVVLTAAVSSRGTAAHGPSASLSGIPVDFYVGAVQFTGQYGTAPMLLLGKASTASNGIATLTYSPTWAGSQPLTAEINDTSGNTLASASTAYAATAASTPFKGTVQSRRPDGTLGKWLAGVLLSALAVLWIVLFGTAVRVNLLFKATHHDYAR